MTGVPQDEGRRFPLCDPGPLLGGTGPAAAYVAGLPEDRRERLTERLDRSLPRNDAGAIDLVARAWAVRGTVQAPPRRP